jgi:glycerophosphoryl diester phosphodiesterase
MISDAVTIPKSSHKPNEDAYVISNHYVAVVDGSTSKSTYTGAPPGKLAADAISSALSSIKSNLTARQCVDLLTECVSSIPLQGGDAPSASVAIVSLALRQIWVVGDMNIRVGNTNRYFRHYGERHTAGMRAYYLTALIQQGLLVDNVLSGDDPGRELILPMLKEESKLRNVDLQGRWYWGSIDGTHIPERHIKQISLPLEPVTVCLASDGYPRLFDSLEQTERVLRDTITRDPLMISVHPETKGVYRDQSSFDDRTYVKLTI